MVLQKASLSEQIENMLKEQILSGTLAPGQQLSVQELASKWEVSGTPIRDAIQRLEKIGFLKVAPRRGVYVNTMDKRTFKDIFELRIAMECLAAETATERIPQDELDDMARVFATAKQQYEETGNIELLEKNDSLIHDTIIKYSDNEKLIQIMNEFSDLIAWARFTVVERQPSSYTTALDDHLKIIDSLQARDTATTITLLKQHFGDTLSHTLDLFNGQT